MQNGKINPTYVTYNSAEQHGNGTRFSFIGKLVGVGYSGFNSTLIPQPSIVQ